MVSLRRLRGHCALLLLLAAWGVALQASEPEGVTARTDLWALYQEARTNDPRVLAAEAGVRLGSHQRREALGRLLPQVSADSRFTQTAYEQADVDTDYAGERYAVGLNQVLFDQQTWQQYQRSRALAEQYAYDGTDRIHSAAIDLVERYLNVLAAQDSLELIQAEKRAVESNLDRVDSLYDRQLASITDKLEVEARVDRLAAAEIEAENAIAVAREGLTEVVGRPIPESLERLQEDPALEQLFDLRDFEYWRTQAQDTSPVVAAKVAAVRAQEAAKKEAFGDHLPRVSLQVAAQRTDIGYENAVTDVTESEFAAINVLIPLFSSGSTSASVRAAVESLYIARQDLESARREVFKETKVAYMNSITFLSKARAAKVAVKSSVKAREAAEKSFSYGMMSAVDVLDRAREQYSAERDLLEAQYRFLLSYVVLKRWSGTFSEEDLQQVNALLGASG